MNQNLFNIGQEFLRVSSEIEINNGELTPELEQALQMTEDNFQIKAIGYAHVCKQLNAEVDIINEEIKRLQALKKTKQNTFERLRGTISNYMNLFGTKEIKTATNKLSFRKSTMVEVFDAKELPVDCLTTKVEINKTMIRHKLKEGANVPGAKLVTNESLQIK